jgi:hypothetical protein
MPSFSIIVPAPDYSEVCQVLSRKQPKQPTAEFPVGLGQAAAPNLQTVRRRATASPKETGDNVVPKEKPLKLEDFPVHTKQKEIVTDTGRPIAGTRDKATAEDVADRLNSDHAQEEQDRWA